MNRDELGIIGQIQGEDYVEGGDSLAWMGHWLYLNGGKDDDGIVVQDIDSYVDFFKVGFGAYVRHPSPHNTNNGFGAYYKNPWNGCISRDQLTGLLAALVYGQKSWEIIQIWLHSLCWFGLFTYNTIKNGINPKDAKWKIPDIIFLSTWAMMLRGFGKFSYLIYPLIMFCDLHILISAAIANYSKDSDKIAHAARLLISNEIVPTPVSVLAWEITNKEKLMRQLTDYWCGFRDSPEYIPLYESKFKNLGE